MTDQTVTLTLTEDEAKTLAALAVRSPKSDDFSEYNREIDVTQKLQKEIRQRTATVSRATWHFGYEPLEDLLSRLSSSDGPTLRRYLNALTHAMRKDNFPLAEGYLDLIQNLLLTGRQTRLRTAAQDAALKLREELLIDLEGKVQA